MAEQPTAANAWRQVHVADPRARALLEVYCGIASAVLGDVSLRHTESEALNEALTQFDALVEVLELAAAEREVLLQLRDVVNGADISEQEDESCRA